MKVIFRVVKVIMHQPKKKHRQYREMFDLEMNLPIRKNYVNKRYQNKNMRRKLALVNEKEKDNLFFVNK